MSNRLCSANEMTDLSNARYFPVSRKSENKCIVAAARSCSILARLLLCDGTFRVARLLVSTTYRIHLGAGMCKRNTKNYSLHMSLSLSRSLKNTSISRKVIYAVHDAVYLSHQCASERLVRFKRFTSVFASCHLTVTRNLIVIGFF